MPDCVHLAWAAPLLPFLAPSPPSGVSLISPTQQDVAHTASHPLSSEHTNPALIHPSPGPCSVSRTRPSLFGASLPKSQSWVPVHPQAPHSAKVYKKGQGCVCMRSLSQAVPGPQCPSLLVEKSAEGALRMAVGSATESRTDGK